MRRTINMIIILVAVLAVSVMPAPAEWSHDPYENNPVCTEPGNQYSPSAVEDGSGGAITIWSDFRSGSEELYAQRVAADGSLVWSEGGCLVCTGTNIGETRLVTDGSGGAIIAWSDYRSGSFRHYAQRVDAWGSILWTANGIDICSSAEIVGDMQIISDGAGGAIITWWDSRWDYGDIRAQRIDASGALLWDADGHMICVAADQQQYPELTGDGSGGAIIAWEDRRNAFNYKIYAQRVSAEGSVQWAPNGVAICVADGSQFSVTLVTDDSGGAILTWQDARTGADWEIYAQRIDGNGDQLWDSEGIVVSTTGNNVSPKILADGNGGAIIAWDESTADRVFVQRISGEGMHRWPAGGVRVSQTTAYHASPHLVGDGAGGAIITFVEHNSVNTFTAQCIDALGTIRWGDYGTAVSLSPASFGSAPVVSDRIGGIICSWRSERQGFDSDIYAQRVDRHGYLGDPSTFFSDPEDFPDDQGGVLILNWAPGYLDNYPYQVVTHYSVWMRQPEEEERAATPSPLGRWSEGTGLPLETLESLDRDGWAYVDQVPTLYWEGYACQAPTYGVYTGSGEIPWTEYMVVTHTADQWVYWESTVVSGFSVDNLSPGAPLDLTGFASGIDALLGWNPSGHHDEDLSHYEVHRGNAPGFVPDQSSLIGSAVDAEYTDPAPGSGTFHYKVTAVDVHGNEGEPSNEASATFSSDTVATSLSCAPWYGVLPFQAQFTVGIDNLYSGQIRRMAGRIDVTLAGGGYFPGWRAGYTNIAPSSSFATLFGVNFPALATLVGNNSFVFTAVDVTPAPYNQPPYPAAGNSDTATCLVIATAP